MISIIYLLCFTCANSLSLDDAISLFKSKSRQLVHFKKGQELEDSLYNLAKWQRYIGAGIAENKFKYSVTGKAFTNELVPYVSLFDLNLSFNMYQDTDIGFTAPYSYSASYKLTELFGSQSGYLLTQLEAKKNLTKVDNEKAWDNSIAELIDLFITVKILEERLEIKKRSFDRLSQDRVYISGRLKAGTASKLDEKLINLEVDKVLIDMENIKRNIELSMVKLSDKLGENIEVGEVADVDVEVSYKDKKIYELEESIKSSEALMKYYNKESWPNLSAGVEYVKSPNNDGTWTDFDTRINVTLSWSIFGDTSSAMSAQRDSLALQNQLELAKTQYEIDKNALLSEYVDMLEGLKSSELERDYLEKLAKVKHEMFLGGLISLSEYLEFHNKHKDQESDTVEQKYKIISFKRKNS